MTQFLLLNDLRDDVLSPRCYLFNDHEKFKKRILILRYTTPKASPAQSSPSCSPFIFHNENLPFDS